MCSCCFRASAAGGAGFSGRGVVYALGAGFCWPSEDSGAPWATSGATTGRGAGSGAFTGSSATVGVVGTCSSRSSAGRCRRRRGARSEEHTSELQSRGHLVCRLLLEKKNDNNHKPI